MAPIKKRRIISYSITTEVVWQGTSNFVFSFCGWLILRNDLGDGRAQFCFWYIPAFKPRCSTTFCSSQCMALYRRSLKSKYCIIGNCSSRVFTGALAVNPDGVWLFFIFVPHTCFNWNKIYTTTAQLGVLWWCRLCWKGTFIFVHRCLISTGHNVI
jgi:hypothetical protein